MFRLLLIAFLTLSATSVLAQTEQASTPNSSFASSFDTLRPKIRKCSQEIIAGHNRFCAASTLAGISQHALEEHAVHIYVQYEPRPIGGILTVRADLVPAFTGIGQAARAIKSEVLTQAVDKMTAEQVEEIAQSLVALLGEEYTQGTVFRSKVAKESNGSVVVNTDFRMSPHTHGME